MMTKLPFDAAIDLDRLRERTSEKWRRYPDDVLPVFVAESDFPLAPPIAERLREAIEKGDLGYAQPRGLGEAYAFFSRTRYGVDVDSADVVALPEVMVGVAEILRVIARPGDRVVINAPVYPPFYSTIEEAGCVVDNAPLRREGEAFVLDLEAIEARMREGSRVLLLCSPHNPVGRVHALEELRAVAALARRYDAVVLSDEIHGPLVLGDAHFTPFAPVAREFDIAAITLTSASKGWNIPGLKCAIAVACGEAGRQILRRLPKAMTERTGHLGVHATIAAFRESLAYLDDVVVHLEGMREQLGTIFAQAGLQAIRLRAPDAGYLAWLDCSQLGLDRPASVFYKRGKVALNPGEAFGPGFEQWCRFNFATSTAIVSEAARRMAAAVTLADR
jgi:cysteine-S-conjugate beta-lyase